MADFDKSRRRKIAKFATRGTLQPIVTTDATPPSRPLPDPIGGRYRIVSRLGVGGMGIVYTAIDTQLNRPVAVKALEEGASHGDDRCGGQDSPAASRSQLKPRPAYRRALLNDQTEVPGEQRAADQ